MSATSESRSWRHAPRWMKGLLVISLSLNLAVIGLVGGNAIRHWHGDRFADAETAPGLDRRQTRILNMIPEGSREEARAILLAHQDALDAAREAMREANMEFIQAIRQDPLDPQELDQALEHRHDASGRYWRIGSEQIVAIARELNAEERERLADRLEERTKRWMKRWKREESEEQKERR